MVDPHVPLPNLNNDQYTAILYHLYLPALTPHANDSKLKFLQ